MVIIKINDNYNVYFLFYINVKFTKKNRSSGKISSIFTETRSVIRD